MNEYERIIQTFVQVGCAIKQLLSARTWWNFPLILTTSFLLYLGWPYGQLFFA